MKKVYICGHFNPEKFQQSIELFEAAQQQLEAAGKNATSIINQKIWDANNPTAELQTRYNALLQCDEVFVLPCWNEDKLARLEIATALIMGIKIVPATNTILPRQLQFFLN